MSERGDVGRRNSLDLDKVVAVWMPWLLSFQGSDQVPKTNYLFGKRQDYKSNIREIMALSHIHMQRRPFNLFSSTPSLNLKTLTVRWVFSSRFQSILPSQTMLFIYSASYSKCDREELQPFGRDAKDDTQYAQAAHSVSQESIQSNKDWFFFTFPCETTLVTHHHLQH